MTSILLLQWPILSPHLTYPAKHILKGDQILLGLQNTMLDWFLCYFSVSSNSVSHHKAANTWSGVDQGYTLICSSTGKGPDSQLALLLAAFISLWTVKLRSSVSCQLSANGHSQSLAMDAFLTFPFTSSKMTRGYSNTHIIRYILLTSLYFIG